MSELQAQKPMKDFEHVLAYVQRHALCAAFLEGIPSQVLQDLLEHSTKSNFYNPDEPAGQLRYVHDVIRYQHAMNPGLWEKPV